MSDGGEEARAGQVGASPRLWTFADCLLDERALELKVAGRVADLDRKPMEVLLYLLRHAGEVVTKDELAEGVWPGRIITDSNLTKTVAVLRAALGVAGAAAIKTVHGYGYRLVAPVSVQALESGEPPTRFDFKPGENPPLRPDWNLERRIGIGGHGEVWLARHVRTGNERVFKFAEEGKALTALKREVTLNRLLREMLPGREDFVRLQDWNFEQPPFFLASDLVAGGNLAQWAEAKGGWAEVPIETRIELVAQAAEALAAAHSVGVLHKDLKPANVLVEERGGELRIRLADFGSGGVLDPAALEALGFTQMGFTQTVSLGDATTGTPVYLAPEVIAGNPFTVQSDIYALGVMLYQLTAGDLRKALAPGWESDVPDALLREDITQAAAGDPAARLGDAALLAQRLRELPRRRQAMEHARAQRVQLELAQRHREQLRRLRTAAAALVVVAGLLAAAGLTAMRARDEARRANATTQAVNQFLNKDMLARAAPYEGATRELTVRQMLDQAAESVDRRLGDQPEAAGAVHQSLGITFVQLGEVERALHHARRATELLAAALGPNAVATLEAQRDLSVVMWNAGLGTEGCALFTDVRARMEEVLGDDEIERRLGLRGEAAECAESPEEIAGAIPVVAQAVDDFERRGMTGSDWYPRTLRNLASVHMQLFQFGEAERQLRRLVAHSDQHIGPQHYRTSQYRLGHAAALINLGQLNQAEAVLDRALAGFHAWSGEGFERNSSLLLIRGLLYLEQGRFKEAEADARSCLNGPFAEALRPEVLPLLSESLLMQGRLTEARTVAEDAVRLSRTQELPVHFYELPSRVHWAEALRLDGKSQEAWQVLEAMDPASLAPLPPDAEGRALLARAQGLLWLQDGKAGQGRDALEKSLSLYQGRYGPNHWRTKRAEAELAALTKA